MPTLLINSKQDQIIDADVVYQKLKMNKKLGEVYTFYESGHIPFLWKNTNYLVKLF